MPDGSQWDVPVAAIAMHRAEHFKHEFADLSQSLAKDTNPLFECEQHEISDWAANNMNWDDVKMLAVRSQVASRNWGYQEGWVNGKKELL